jgi:hypothetical protein
MNSKWSNDRGALEHRLSVIGIPRHLIPQFVDLFVNWVTHNGPEWAVKRFKSLKVDLIRQHSGLPLLTTYVRKNTRGSYHGVIGALFRWAERSEKKFSQTIQAFCIYTSEISHTETKSQLDKFIGAVSCSEPTGVTEDFLTRLSWTSIVECGRQSIDKVDNRLITYRGSPEKIAPLPHNQGYVPQDCKILLETSWMRNMKNLSFARKHWGLYGPVLSGIGELTQHHHIEQVDRTSYAGEVHFIQEPGYKLRAVASPYRLHQLALQPLGSSIGRIVQSLPWDCTFDQSKAFPIIQEKLRSGCTIHSVDLSNATDYFPLDLQVMVLRTVFGDIPDIHLFQDLSRMTWKSKYGDIRWNRGQPLGLYPSFFAFTLTHGLVLRTLCEHRDNEFLVVGDDVVIFTEELYLKYIEFLNATKCPYSVDKSLSSSSLAEFAGKVVTPDRVIPQLKWRKMSNDSFLDLAKLLGPRSRSLMTPRQQKVFDAVKHLLPPIGLNMSTPGSTYLSAFMQTEKVLAGLEQSTVSSLTGLIRIITDNSMEDPNARILYADTSAFDEKVRMVFQKTVFSHWLWLEQVAELPQALGLTPRLPIMAHPHRSSTLSRYERILDRVIK